MPSSDDSLGSGHPLRQAQGAEPLIEPVEMSARSDKPMTITLWDFSWYVRSGPGEPFEDLDRAFTEAAARGYDTVRVCAMPFLLFGSGLDTSHVGLDRLGGEYGMRVRWYDVGAPTVVDGRAKLLELLDGASRHGFRVIISSWEYQQSSSFATDSAWFDALMAVDPEARAEGLADSLADLVDFAEANGVGDPIALIELHNEVQGGHLTDGLNAGTRDDLVVALKPRLERGLARFHTRHPDRLCTVNYAGVPVGAFRGVPDSIDALVVHPYVYGVLGAFMDAFGLRGPLEDVSQKAAEEAFLLPGAPPAHEWRPAESWKAAATIVSPATIYAHDWGDTERIDRWLYDHYGEHRIAMEQKLRLWMDTAADFAAQRSVPLVFGEGWVGYTPLEGTFEEGPVGAEFCRLAAREAARVGAAGSIVCSNAAPQHPMWADIDLQRDCNRLFFGRPHLPSQSAPTPVPERTPS